MESNQTIIDILSIVLPVLIAAGAGGAALYRQMRAEEKAKRLELNQRGNSANQHRIAMDTAAWQRAQATIESLGRRVEALEASLDRERGLLRDAEDRIDVLEAENVKLRDALAGRGGASSG